MNNENLTNDTNKVEELVNISKDIIYRVNKLYELHNGIKDNYKLLEDNSKKIQKQSKIITKIFNKMDKNIEENSVFHSNYIYKYNF